MLIRYRYKRADGAGQGWNYSEIKTVDELVETMRVTLIKDDGRIYSGAEIQPLTVGNLTELNLNRQVKISVNTKRVEA